LWSERYDRDLTDIFAIQDEIAGAIADALQVKLSTEPTIRRRHEPKPASYEAYLKARHYWGKLQPEFLTRSREHLEHAIALDPEFALAHCGYADHFLFLASIGYLPAHEAMPLVHEEAQMALEIDPSLPEAQAMLGIVAGVYNYDWKEADRRFRLALAYDPVPPRVRQWYGHLYLLPMGRLGEAVEQIDQGLKEDPLNITARLGLAYSLITVGRMADAQAELHRILEFEENHVIASMFLALTYARQEKWVEALHLAEKATPMIPQAIGVLAGMMRHMGEVKRAEELIQKLMPGEAYNAPVGLCHFYFLCGEINRAADWLEKAIEQRYPNAAVIASMFFHSSPRWSSLAGLMNLPAEVG
jgi:serine/threonine-protein kinase